MTFIIHIAAWGVECCIGRLLDVQFMSTAAEASTALDYRGTFCRLPLPGDHGSPRIRIPLWGCAPSRVTSRLQLLGDAPATLDSEYAISDVHHWCHPFQNLSPNLVRTVSTLEPRGPRSCREPFTYQSSFVRMEQTWTFPQSPLLSRGLR